MTWTLIAQRVRLPCTAGEVSLCRDHWGPTPQVWTRTPPPTNCWPEAAPGGGGVVCVLGPAESPPPPGVETHKTRFSKAEPILDNSTCIMQQGSDEGPNEQHHQGGNRTQQ